MKFIQNTAAIYALLAVALGAFGAHALKETLRANSMLEAWNTAVDYQMWHALAILAVSAIKLEGRSVKISLGCFAIGILIFSGSLFGLALGGPSWLGSVTPFGGTLLIAGWAFLIASLSEKTP